MDALTPSEPQEHNGAGPQCKHGLLHDGRCGDLRYRFVEDRSAYFTSWNFFLIIAALALVLLVYLPANLIDGGSFLQGKYGFLVNYIVTPLIITSVIGSIGVLLTSQSIVAFNFQQMVEIGHIPPVRTAIQQENDGQSATSQVKRTLAHPEVDSSRVSVQMDYLQYLLQDNFVVHIAPAIIAVVILMLLAVGTFQTAERETVALVVLIFCLVIWAVYFAVPVKDPDTGEDHIGWNKVAHVYSEPSGWIFAGQFVFSAAAAFMIPFFVIGKGPSSMDQIRGTTPEPLMPGLEAFVNQLTAGASAVTSLGPVRGAY